jgi:hypothetical protein
MWSPAGLLEAAGRRAPVWVVRRRPLEPPRAERIARLRARPLGFLGAAEEDQARWLYAFRRLLDALELPIQVVMRFQPGAGEVFQVGPSSPPSRALDVEYVNRLLRETGAQAREVEVITAPEAAESVVSAMLELGLSDIETDDVTASDTEADVEYRGAVRDSEGWHRTWYLERFPGIELAPGWLLRLVPSGLDVTIAWHATPVPTASMVDYLQRQLAHMRASVMQTGAGGANDPALAGAVPAAEQLQRQLTASEARAFHVAVYLTVSTESPDDLKEAARRVETAARGALSRLQPCSFRMRDGLLSARSLGRDRLGRTRVLDTPSAATLFPWLDADLHQPDGLMVGVSRATGSPVVVDPFDDQRFANGNIGVFGHSGAGKTYLLSTLLMGALGTGTQVFVMDPEHEYGRLAERLGGVDVNFSLGSRNSMNVLELRPGRALEEVWLGPAVADAVDLVAIVCGGADEPERADLEAAVRSAYTDLAEPVLADVASRLVAGTRVRRILDRWVTGSLGRLFSAPTNVDLEAPVVVFGMREMREELIAPVHFLLAEALWGRIKSRRRRRLLVVDELGLLFEDSIIRKFVVTLARRIRKYDGSLVFATQNPGDLLSSEAGAVVATNPALQFFGAQRPGEAARLQRAFRLSDTQRTLLESARRGDFLLCAGAERLAIRVQAPEWQAEAMKASRAPPGPTV